MQACFYFPLETCQRNKHEVVATIFYFNPSPPEAEVVRSLLGRAQPCLQSKFQNSQGYTEKSYVKQNKKQQAKDQKKKTNNSKI